MDEVEHSNSPPRRHNPFLNVEVEMDSFRHRIHPDNEIASVHVASSHIPMSI